jgi:tetratricopeptide (TPR) repeat protein
MASGLAGAPPAPSAPVRELTRRAGAEEGLGEWDEAARLYSLAFRSSVLGRDIAAAADALRGQARVRNHQRRFDEAEELAMLSLEIAARNGLEQAAARALNVLGVVLQARGDWDEARRIFPRVLERALDLGDDELAGLACLNEGVIEDLTGKPREARTLFLQSIGSFVRSGNSVHAMLAYNNLGIVSARLREWMEAEVFFSRGIEIGERLAHAPQLAKLYCNRAEPLIHVGEDARALASLDRAESFARQVGDRGVLVRIDTFRGTIHRRRGDLDEAERRLRRAVESGAGSGLASERAEALRLLGEVHLEQGRGEEGRAMLRTARALFRSLGADAAEEALAERLRGLEQ